MNVSASSAIKGFSNNIDELEAVPMKLEDAEHFFVKGSLLCISYM